MIQILIVFFGAAALIFAVLVVTLRQPMRAALSLIAHMVCLAALFAALAVHVIALFQILIYVGAVMVLMIYTIMLLDDRDTSYVHIFSRRLVPAIAAVAVAIGALGSLLTTPAASPAAVATPTRALYSFATFSDVFMRGYWFDFDLATVLLVISIVSVWTVIGERR